MKSAIGEIKERKTIQTALRNFDIDTDFDHITWGSDQNKLSRADRRTKFIFNSFFSNPVSKTMKTRGPHTLECDSSDLFHESALKSPSTDRSHPFPIPQEGSPGSKPGHPEAAISSQPPLLGGDVGNYLAENEFRTSSNSAKITISLVNVIDVIDDECERMKMSANVSHLYPPNMFTS